MFLPVVNYGFERLNRLSITLLILLVCSVALNVHLLVLKPIVQITTDYKQQFSQTPSTADSNTQVIVQNVSATPSKSVSQSNDLTKKDQAQDYFNRAMFEEAFELYEQLTTQDEQAAMDLHRIWLEILKERLKTNDLSTIEPFLEVFLTGYPFDQKYLALKAETLVALTKINDAIGIYYSLIDYSYEIKEQEYYQARIRHLTNERVDSLVKNQSWQGVLDFIEPILMLESNFPPYLLSQAEALIKLGRLDEAESILEPLLDISYYRQRAQSLLNEINRSRLQVTAIKLEPKGEHYLVNGIIDSNSQVKLMIDTGASISVLTQAMFNQINDWSAPTYIKDVPLNTAGGQVNAPIYEFERFQIDDFYIDNMQFVVLPLENTHSYNGLLGMNFLKHFKFEIDQENNLLILSP